jgi:hypothetical protein
LLFFNTEENMVIVDGSMLIKQKLYQGKLKL